MLLILFACSKQNDINDEDIDVEVEAYLSMRDIEGVWTLENNDLYFISLSPSGHYSFCFNNEIMGSGTFVLNENNLLFNNGYLYSSDKVNVRKDGNKLSLNGNVTTYLLGKKYVNLKFVKSTEQISPSVVGKVIPDDDFTGLNEKYKDLETEIIYMTEYVAKYEYTGKSKKTGKRELIKEYVWYYVYREPYTYTQVQNGNGEVLIYDFSSGVCSGNGLEFDLVEQ